MIFLFAEALNNVRIRLVMIFIKLQKNLAILLTFAIILNLTLPSAYSADPLNPLDPGMPVITLEETAQKNQQDPTVPDEGSMQFMMSSNFALSSSARLNVSGTNYIEVDHTILNGSPIVEAVGGNDISGKPPGYVRLTQSSSKAYEYRYNISGSKTAYVENSIRFDSELGNLPENVILGLQGPAGVSLAVDVEDASGEMACFLLFLTGSFQNYSLDLNTAGVHVSDDFDRTQIASIKFRVDREGFPANSQWIDFIRVRTAGLFHLNVPGTAFDESAHTVMDAFPSVEAIAGNTEVGKPAAFMQFDHFSERSFQLRYNIKPSKTSFVKSRIVFDKKPGSLPENVVMGIKGPLGVAVGLRVTDANGREATFRLEMSGSLQNYTFNLNPSRPNVDDAFDRTKVVLMEFEVNRELIPDSALWRDFLEFRSLGLGYFVQGGALNENALTVHSAQPNLTAVGANTDPLKTPGFIQMTQLSGDELEYVYNVKHSKTALTYVELSRGSFDVNGVFQGEALSLPEQFAFAAQGPEATQLQVEIADTSGHIEHYTVRLRPAYQNFILNLKPESTGTQFNRTQIAYVRFIQDQAHVGTRQRELVKIKTRGLTPVSPNTPSPALLQFKQETVAKMMDYYDLGVGVDPVTHFPYDSVDGAGVANKYTQPTSIGFYLQLLGDIANGAIPQGVGFVGAALTEMQNVLTSLENLQTQSGWNGLVPWVDLDGTHHSPYFTQYAIGDNANLAQSMAVAAGALERASLTTAQRTQANAIVQRIDQFLDRQRPGYEAMVDSESGLFRLAYVPGNSPAENHFEGYMDRFANEFRGTLAFLVARFPAVSKSVWANPLQAFRVYTDRNGQAIENMAPWDGGAFQMFWPLLRNNERDFLAMREALYNNFATHTDAAYQNRIPGFLSASQTNDISYTGRIGVPGIAESESEYITDIGSFYALAAASAVDPSLVLTWMKNIAGQMAGTGFENGLGYFDAARSKNEIAKRHLAIDTASLILGLTGEGPKDFEAYMRKRNLELAFNLLYDERSQFAIKKANAAQIAPIPDIHEKSLAVFSHLAAQGHVGSESFGAQATEFHGARYSFGVLDAGNDEHYGGRFYILDQSYDARGHQLRIRYQLEDSPEEFKIEIKNSQGQPVLVTYVPALPGFPFSEAVIDIPNTAAFSDIKEVILIVDQDHNTDTSGNFYLNSINFMKD